MSGNTALKRRVRKFATHRKVRGARHAHQHATPAEHQDGEESIDRKAYEKKGAQGLTRELRVCRDRRQGRVLVSFEVGVRLEADSRSVAPSLRVTVRGLSSGKARYFGGQHPKWQKLSRS